MEEMQKDLEILLVVLSQVYHLTYTKEFFPTEGEIGSHTIVTIKSKKGDMYFKFNELNKLINIWN